MCNPWHRMFHTVPQCNDFISGVFANLQVWQKKIYIYIAAGGISLGLGLDNHSFPILLSLPPTSMFFPPPQLVHTPTSTWVIYWTSLSNTGYQNVGHCRGPCVRWQIPIKKDLIKRLHQTCQPFGVGKSFKSCLIFLIIKTPDEPIDICVGVLNLLILTVTLWRTFWSSESLNTSALTFRVHLVMLLCSRFFVEVKAYTWCNTDNIVYVGGIKDNEIHVL